MGEKEDKEKAEKLAAAKKRVAQLQKKKKAAAAKDKPGKEDTPKSPTKGESAPADDAEDAAEQSGDVPKEADIQDGPPAVDPAAPAAAAEDEDADEALFNDAIKAASTSTAAVDGEADPDTIGSELTNHKTRTQPHARQPSLSVQSKIRSTSFRHTPANGPLSPQLTSAVVSPDGESAPEIYRKQAVRLEELEKENKRLAREVDDGEIRWRKSEEQMEKMRERVAERLATTAAVGAAGASGADEVERLRSEIASLRSAQKGRAGSVSFAKAVRSGSNPDLATGELSGAMKKELETKDATIADMALEISKLRTQISSQMAGCETHGEQIAALQKAVDGAEGKLRNVQGELGDAKKALERASERRLREETDRTSKETRVKELEREVTAWNKEKSELQKKAEGLEKKADVMGRLQRESEERWAKRVDVVEKENKRLREDKMRRVGRGGDGVEGDDGGQGLEELEDEERGRLEGRVRELEGELFELRRGVWRERRGLSGGDEAGMAHLSRPSFEVEGFDEVDLSGGASGKASRSRSFAHATPQQPQKHSGFSQVITSGLAAFRGSTTSPEDAHARPRNDSLLPDFDDDELDEAAFAQAQREEEARKMVEHVREVKRGLKQWAGWRLDLVEIRRGMGAGDGSGGWLGDIFEV